MNLDYKTVIAGGAVVLILAYLAKKQAAAAVEAVGTAVNPLSSENLAYKGVNAVTGAITGNKWFISDIFGGNSYNPNAPTQPTP